MNPVYYNGPRQFFGEPHGYNGNGNSSYVKR
jgi:hypothetical protein